MLSSSVPLILGDLLRTARALIDVYGEELTLRVDDEAITFKVGLTSRCSYNDAVSINRIDVIDVACEEYAQEVLGFSDSSTSGNPTPSLDTIPIDHPWTKRRPISPVPLWDVLRLPTECMPSALCNASGKRILSSSLPLPFRQNA
ncbi:hypothetical protein Tco_0462381 [Tanacetum coccineum]